MYVKSIHVREADRKQSKFLYLHIVKCKLISIIVFLPFLLLGQTPCDYDFHDLVYNKMKIDSINLIEKTESDDAFERVAAFYNLAKYYPKTDIPHLFLNHLYDTTHICFKRNSGFVGVPPPINGLFKTGDVIYLMFLKADETFLGKNQERYLQIRKDLDSILVFHPNGLYFVGYAIQLIENQDEKTYLRLKTIYEKEQNPYALIRIAEYQKEVDTAIIMDHYLVDRYSSGFTYKYKAIAKFPHPAFLPDLERNILNDPSLDYFLTNTLLQYPPSETGQTMQKVLEKISQKDSVEQRKDLNTLTKALVENYQNDYFKIIDSLVFQADFYDHKLYNFIKQHKDFEKSIDRLKTQILQGQIDLTNYRNHNLEFFINYPNDINLPVTIDEKIKQFLLNERIYSYSLIDAIESHKKKKKLIVNEITNYIQDSTYKSNTNFELLLELYRNLFDDYTIPNNDEIIEKCIYSNNPEVIKNWSFFDLSAADEQKIWVSHIIKTGTQSCELKHLVNITHILQRYNSKKIMRKWKRGIKSMNCKNHEDIEIVMAFIKQGW